MNSKADFKKAIETINEKKLLLVFPITNKRDPPSLWFEFYPEVSMDWKWTEDADSRVLKTWMLMKKLSDCQEVVYSKWYQGRATFFSKDFFKDLLAFQMKHIHPQIKLTHSESTLLQILQNNSPLSTKELKKEAGLTGKLFSADYERSMKRLFLFQKIVAFGEVEDGAFPSLAVGATSLLFEDIWCEAQEISQARTNLHHILQVLNESKSYNYFFQKNFKINDFK